VTSKDHFEMRKVFQEIALKGTAIFLERLVPKEKIEHEYLRFTRENARNYLLLKLLTEVQKTGFVFYRWNDYLENNKLESSTNVDVQILETLIDEQSLWQRKLIEGLVVLINFSLTNELPFYYHFLLLQELNHYHNMLLEQKDFFNHGSALTQKTIDLLTNQIQTIENDIGGLTKCWYLSKAKPIKKGERPGISSLRQQMKKALSIATSGEKTAIGYTYSAAYAETSGNIHFNALKLDLNNLPSRFFFGFAQCGKLALTIIQRAHDLAKVEPEGINKLLMKQNRDLLRNTIPTLKKLEKGDFVLANGPYLGEVTDVSLSAFGYESYLVKYLEETPLEGIDKDWFPSFNVQLFMKRSNMVKDVSDVLQKEASEFGVLSQEFSEQEIYKSTRLAVVEIWRRGISEYIERTMIPKQKGYAGMGYNPLHKDE
jgi:hypothetical protein